MTDPELWTTAEAAEYLGASSAGSGRKTLSRLGVTPTSREPELSTVSTLRHAMLGGDGYRDGIAPLTDW